MYMVKWWWSFFNGDETFERDDTLIPKRRESEMMGELTKWLKKKKEEGWEDGPLLHLSIIITTKATASQPASQPRSSENRCLQNPEQFCSPARAYPRVKVQKGSYIQTKRCHITSQLCPSWHLSFKPCQDCTCSASYCVGPTPQCWGCWGIIFFPLHVQSKFLFCFTLLIIISLIWNWLNQF